MAASVEHHRQLVASFYGAGMNTTVLGGGDVADVHGVKPTFLIDSLDVNGTKWKKWPLKQSGGYQDFSDGYARWLAMNVWMHTDRRDTPGVFVEFGARDGLHQSNTWLYEKYYGWSGVLVDAGRDYMARMRENRNCRVNGHPQACVWAALDNTEGVKRHWVPGDRVTDTAKTTGFKTDLDYIPVAADHEVSTMRLQQILDKFGVTRLDYVSADCEGCEAEALAGLDFERITVDVFTVENAPCVSRARISALGPTNCSK
jgi:FkbM family methyltransferase